jgi:hypothetical protein
MPTLNRFPADQDPASKTKTKRKRRVLEPIDLKNVPDQPLILKNAISQNYEDNSRRRPVKEGKSSRYAGIYFDDKLNKWKAQMMINREVRSLGYHDSEEAAAAIYAKAAFKYKTKKANQTTFGGMDLGNVPAQSFLRNERASSGYKGVKKSKNGTGGKHELVQSHWELLILRRRLLAFMPELITTLRLKSVFLFLALLYNGSCSSMKMESLETPREFNTT